MVYDTLLDRRTFVKLLPVAVSGLFSACKESPHPPKKLSFTPETIEEAFTMNNTDRSIIGAATLPSLSSEPQTVVTFSTEKGDYLYNQSMLTYPLDELLQQLHGAIGDGAAAVDLRFQQRLRLVGLLPSPDDFLDTLRMVYHETLPRTLTFEGPLELGKYGRAISLVRSTLGSHPLLPAKAHLLGPRNLTEDYSPILRR